MSESAKGGAGPVERESVREEVEGKNTKSERESRPKLIYSANSLITGGQKL